MLVEKERETFERGALDRVRALMTAIDAELRASITPLEVLARSPAFDGEDLAAFRAEAERALEARRGDWANIVVSDPADAADVDEPAASRPASRSSGRAIRRASSKWRNPGCRRLTQSQRSGVIKRPAFAVRVPVVRNGKIKHVLSAARGDVRLIAKLVDRQQCPDNWAVAVLEAGTTISSCAGRSLRKGPQLCERVAEEGAGRARAKAVSVDGFSTAVRSIALFSARRSAAGRRRSQCRAASSKRVFRRVWLLIARVRRRGSAGTVDRVAARFAHLAAHRRACSGGTRARPRRGLGAAAAGRRRRSAASSRVRWVKPQSRSATGKSGSGRRNRRCATPIARRTNFSRCSATSCAIRSRRCPTRRSCCRIATRPARGARQCQRNSRTAGRAHDAARRRPAGSRSRDRRQGSARACAARSRARRRRYGRDMEGRRALRCTTMSTPTCTLSGCRPTARASSRSISNLLDNALKYTPAGGRIDVSVRPAGNAGAFSRCAIPVVGMAPELIERVFDLFVQGERSLAREQGGLGIGLTMAKRLVELHGGTIRATSDGPGKGADVHGRAACDRAVERERARGAVSGGETASAPHPDRRGQRRRAREPCAAAALRRSRSVRSRERCAGRRHGIRGEAPISA